MQKDGHLFINLESTRYEFFQSRKIGYYLGIAQDTAFLEKSASVLSLSLRKQFGTDEKELYLLNEHLNGKALEPIFSKSKDSAERWFERVCTRSFDIELYPIIDWSDRTVKEPSNFEVKFPLRFNHMTAKHVVFKA
jgi:hypothetical protein